MKYSAEQKERNRQNLAERFPYLDEDKLAVVRNRLIKVQKAQDWSWQEVWSNLDRIKATYSSPDHRDSNEIVRLYYQALNVLYMIYGPDGSYPMTDDLR